MQVADVMTRNVQVIFPETPIEEAARLMAECNCGALPVGDGQRLIGMVTDRDIVTRAVACGLGSGTPVHQVMSIEVKYCFEDELLEHVAHNMGDIQVRRLPVLNRSKQLVGIIALGDIALAQDRAGVSAAMRHISESQTQHIYTGSRPH
ncbi:CBS domain-containing protein [Chitinolyticbacter meiyuanensis]|uniref:CBS domain-containing protein n=1 Tax=Chitinolyticbacter meiyuanensis TaxID=682798 RepID=UPI0011E599B5|nr:CBS domain-containing protein [Chitinolyticbacter meiyuanensis]